MDIIDYIRHLIKSFFTICSCILVGTTVFVTIVNIDVISNAILWQIIVVSAAATLLDFIRYSRRELSGKSLINRNIIHYMLINILLFLAAYFFEWFKLASISKVIFFMLVILVIYVLIYLSIYFIDSVRAKELNEKLIEYKKRRSEVE